MVHIAGMIRRAAKTVGNAAVKRIGKYRVLWHLYQGWHESGFQEGVARTGIYPELLNKNHRLLRFIISERTIV